MPAWGSKGGRNSNMEMSLADQDRAITILPAEVPASQDALGAGPALPTSKRRGARPTSRSTATAAKARKPGAGRSAPVPAVATADFYRDMVWSLRNGVLAVTVDGTV